MENPMELLRRNIAALVNLPESEAPVLSAFIDLRQPVETQRAAFLNWSVSARHTVKRDLRPLFDAARADLEQALKRQWSEEIQSAALFARAGDSPLLLVMPFQATLDTHFDISSRPAIFPLVQLKDRFHRFVVVICTEDTGRVIEVTLGAVSEEILTRRPELAGDLGRGWSREHYHHRRQESSRRFFRDQVEIITRLMNRRGINHLILAGHPRHVAALREMLPKQIESRVVGSVYRAPNGQDCSPVLEQAIHTFIDAEQNESRSTVERLHEQIRRRGLATVGIHASRKAIRQGAAAELVISEELPAPDREELVRLATAAKTPIEVCENDDLLHQHGGVGCMLRYQIEFTDAAGEPAHTS
jgi:ribosomal protein L30E